MREKRQFWLNLVLILLLILSATISFSPRSRAPIPTTTLEVIFPNFTWESVDEWNPEDSFYVRIKVGEVSDLGGFEFKLWYKPAVLTAIDVILFDIASGGLEFAKEVNETIGYVWYSAVIPGGVPGPGGLAAIQFTVDEPGGGSCLYLEDTKLSDSEGLSIPHDVYDGHFETNSVYVHDIGITKVTPASTKVVQGENINVAVVTRNHGYFSESFSVTVYANGTAIGTPNTPVTDLTPGYSTVLTFTWDTAGFALGKYIISANATTVTDEIDPADNTRCQTLDFSSGAGNPHSYVYITTTVIQYPVAVFDYSPELPYVRQPVAFNASESTPEGGTIETYQWNFGDGNYTTPSISFKVHNNTFVAPGTYNVTLTVKDSEGLTATTWKLVTIYKRDIALTNVTAHPTTQYKRLPVFINVTVSNKGQLTETFTVTAYYDGNSVGDPQTVTNLEAGTNKNLTITWDTTYVPATITGTTYQISAQATLLPYEANTTNNRFIDGDVTIIKQPGPLANFTYSPKTPIETEPIDFDASLSAIDPDTNAPIISYDWDYGDGVKEIYIGANITQFATHSYTEAGSYTAKLNVTDSQGLSDAVEATVTVYKHDIAIISVTKDKTKVVVGENVIIDMTVKNEGDFPETFSIIAYANTAIIQTKPATLQSGNSKIETLIWDTTGFPVGTYTIKAEVPQVTGETHTTDNTCTDGTVTVVKRPIASFTYSPTSPAIEDTVTFDASASTPNGGTITSYRWNFGDNNVTTVTNPNIIHIYATPETFTVTLNITDSEGLWNTTSKLVTISKMSSTITIAVSQVTITLGKSAIITGSLTPIRTGVNVTISQRKTGTQTWNALATVKTNQTGQYSYTWTPTAYGTFELKSNWMGDANTLQAESETKTIVVKAPPTASFTYTPSAPFAGDPVTFTSTSTDPDGTIQSLNWDFGDGGKANGQITTHTYTTAGDFTVNLTATDNDGLTHTFTKTITITVKGTTGFPVTLIAAAAAIVVIAVVIAAYYLTKKKP